MPYPEKNISEASSAELYDSLQWQKSLIDHYDETFDHRNYHESVERAKQIQRELDRRAHT